jgi:hypothetical protein
LFCSDFIENEFKKKNYSVEDTVDVLLKFDKTGKKKFHPISLDLPVPIEASSYSSSRSSSAKNIEKAPQEDIPYFGRAVILDSSR